MIFRQILYRDLGCASYLLGDAGQAVVVDPRWDIDVYRDIAATERLEIVEVLDTHDHADHVSGRLKLAAVTGARSRRPDAGDAVDDVIAPGDEIRVGALRIRAVGTPGHRPEHLTFAVCDLARGDDPWLLLTGDSLLVGDVARPDLAYQAQDGAHALYASLRLLTEHEDHVEVWPAHVGGSLCGGENLSGKTSSTVGFERRHNPLLTLAETPFVEKLTHSLPTKPPNIDRIVSLNRATAYVAPAPPVALAPAILGERIAAGAIALDGRSPDAFDGAHLQDAVNLPVASPGVGTRAGWAFALDDEIVVVAGDAAGAQTMVSALQAVGFGRVAGYAVVDVQGWRAAGLPVVDSAAWGLDRVLAGLRGDTVELIDVREPSEWIRGHVPGSHHVPLRRMRDVATIPRAAPGHVTAVACAAGARAAFAASLLRRDGRRDVVRVTGGGVPDLEAKGLELESG